MVFGRVSVEPTRPYICRLEDCCFSSTDLNGLLGAGQERI
jgi:hypothetical protein